MYKSNKFFGFILLVFWLAQFYYPIPMRGQTNERNLTLQQQGLPYFQVYSSRDYQASRANWWAIQDKKGRMLFANSSGLLSYDGVKWSLTETPNKTVIRYLASHEDGTIYYGAKDDFGYLSSDSIGNLQLISIASQIPEEIEPFRDIWGIQVIEDKIYFHSYHYIFQFQKKGDGSEAPIFERMVKNENRIITLSKIGEELFVYILGAGLHKWLDGELQLLEIGAFFKEKSIRAILPLGKENNNDSLLICSRRYGLFIWDRKENNLAPLVGGYSSFMEKTSLNYAVYLKNGHLAIGTEAGLIILDKNWQIIDRANQDMGLPSNDIQFIWEDIQSGLWLITYNGLVRVETSSPLRRFGEPLGLNQHIYSITKHKDQLYIGTNAGVFTSSKDEQFSLKKIKGLETEVFFMLSMGDDLLIACPYDGVFELKDEKFVKILGNIPVTLIQSRFDSNLVMVGTGSSHFGFCFLYKQQDGWKRILTQPIIKEEIRYIAEEANGIIWLGSRENGFFRLEIPEINKIASWDFTNSNNVDPIQAKIEQYPKEKIPPGFRSRPYLVNNQVYLASNYGLKHFSNSQKALIADSSLGMVLADTLTQVNQIVGGQNGSFWANYIPPGQSARIFRFSPNEKNGFKEEEAFLVRRAFESPFVSMYAEPNGPDGIWLGTPNGLLWYDANTPSKQMTDYYSLITAVWSNGDSLIFGGYNINRENPFQRPTLAFADNALRFEFGATTYEVPGQNQYQYFLEGFDKDWSNWTHETRKDYTNLPEGSYTFRLKVKNIYDVIGKEATFQFNIKPPWHRSLLAYFSYVVLISLGLYWAYRWNVQKLKKRQKRLERKVAIRTKEVNQQKEEIAEQSLQLLEKNEQLEALDQYKRELTGMIVHDLKNPLNAILGFTESPNLNSQRKKIVQSGNIMLSLVTNILDVQKFEEAKMELHLGDYKLRGIISLAADRVSLLKEEKNILLEVNIEQQSWVRVDKDLVIRVFENLFSNAIKFSPVNKKVCIYATPSEKEGMIKIMVEDEGPGIPEDQVHKLFSRFGQVEQRKTGRAESTGLGLTFCKLAVEAHGGTIGTELPEKTGTKIWFTLPASKIKQQSNLADSFGQEPSTIYSQEEIGLNSIGLEEKEWFLPLVRSLSDYKVFHISEVLELLNKIPSHASPAIQHWQSKIEQSIYTSNENIFDDLVKKALSVE